MRQHLKNVIPACLVLILASFFPLSAQPAAPVLVSPANGTATVSTSITFAWNAVSGATSYTLQISQSSAFSSFIFNQGAISATSQVIGGFSTGSVYFWRVSATGVSGTGGWSGTWNYSVGVLPSAPVLISPTNSAILTQQSPTLAWNSVNGAASYSLQLSTTNSFSTTIAARTGISSSSSSGLTLAGGILYYWRVSSTNIYGTGSWSNIWSFGTISGIPPAPVLQTPSNGAVDVYPRLECAWASVGQFPKYAVQVSSAANFSSLVTDTTGIIPLWFNRSNPLPYNSTFYWRVNASNLLGTSSWSSTWSFTTSAPAPTGKPSLLSPPNHSVQNALPVLSWGIALGATHYVLNYGPFIPYFIGGGSLWHWVYSQTVLSTTSFQIPDSLRYYWFGDTIKWQVWADNGSGSGPASDTFSFSFGNTPVLASAPPLALAESFVFRNSTAVYDLPTPCPVSLSLFTLSGRRIVILDRQQQAGRCTVSLKNRGLAPGAYFLHFKAGRVERKVRVVLE